MVDDSFSMDDFIVPVGVTMGGRKTVTSGNLVLVKWKDQLFPGEYDATLMVVGEVDSRGFMGVGWRGGRAVYCHYGDICQVMLISR